MGEKFATGLTWRRISRCARGQRTGSASAPQPCGPIMAAFARTLRGGQGSAGAGLDWRGRAMNEKCRPHFSILDMCGGERRGSVMSQ